MNWGNKILIGFSTFVVGISCMVYVAMKQTNEMIDDNYYEKELKYQSKIDASKALTALDEKITIVDSADFIKIKFPRLAINSSPTGTIECIRTSEKKRDVNTVLKVDNDGIQLLPKANFIHGQYELRIDWVNAGVTYFHQQVLNIK